MRSKNLLLDKESHLLAPDNRNNQSGNLVYQLYGLTEEEIKIIEKG
ncbi:MAG: hypothetical protein Q8M94_02300 [Ignavibacteria bacterium]|nr:hypothetical protein [Ignavibacteria bacterium]